MADRIVNVTHTSNSALADAVASAANHSGLENNLVFSIGAGAFSPPAIDDCAWATTSDHKIIFTNASGAHHLFTRASGVRIVTSDDWSTFLWSKNYVEFHGIAFTVTASDGIMGAAVSFAQHAVFFQCFAYDCIPGTKATDGCGGLLCCDVGDPQYNKFIDCAAVNVGGPGIGGQYNTVATDMIIYNCTVLNAYIGFSHSSYRNTYAKNNFAGLCTDNYYQGEGGTSYLSTCASPNGDMSTSTISIANCGFTNSTAGSENVHISSGSSLSGAGTDLSSDANYPFSTDGEGTAWGTWGIGALKAVSSVSGNTYYYQQQQM